MCNKGLILSRASSFSQSSQLFKTDFFLIFLLHMIYYCTRSYKEWLQTISGMCPFILNIEIINVFYHLSRGIWECLLTGFPIQLAVILFFLNRMLDPKPLQVSQEFKHSQYHWLWVELLCCFVKLLYPTPQHKTSVPSSTTAVVICYVRAKLCLLCSPPYSHG